MGNQESLPSEKYIVRKKNSTEKNINFNIDSSQYSKKNTEIVKEKSNKNMTINKSFPISYSEKNRNTMKVHRNTPEFTKENTENNKRSTILYEKNDLNYNNEINIHSYHPKEDKNNAIIERNILSDVYNNQRQKSVIFDYPSNSNNELDIPKKNFGNIEFTPYNFNDEVNKYKKNLNDEREDFDKIEKNRRSKFEQDEAEKKNYLDNQIKNFELKYNPWEILGLKYKDYDINNIKKAYKKNALKYHPDRAGNKYENKFQLITQSYIYLLDKAEQYNQTEIKINKKVENVDYEDNINEKAENIYISKDKFDINHFNKIFEDYKVPSTFDKGYSDLMQQDIKNNNNEKVFGKSFNKDVFNAHFEKLKNNNKNNTDIIQYQEPDALDTSLGNLNQSFLGIDEIDDFGAVNSNTLSYTDYKKAHVDETMLIDVNKVKYKTYKSIDQLESDRSKLSYTLSPEDRQRQEYMERKRMEDDKLRIQKQRDYDEMLEQNYNKINRKLIVNK